MEVCSDCGSKAKAIIVKGGFNHICCPNEDCPERTMTPPFIKKSDAVKFWNNLQSDKHKENA